MKACIYCKHCEYEEPCRHSTLTYGVGDFNCRQGKFYGKGNLADGDLFIIAQECDKFELKDEIKELIADGKVRGMTT